MAGDFNFVMDQKLDTINYKNLNNPKARMELIQLMENENLCDVFRFLNPDKMKYTWRKKNPIKQSRLDYFLISESLVPSIQVVDHENSYRSDHTPVVLTLKLTEFKHGKGFWKFNNSLLKDREYVNLVKSQIKETKMQYAALVYQLENINELNDAEIEFRIPDHLFLDTLLMNIRGKTISYSTYKKKMQKETQSNLENEIKLLEENFNEESLKVIEEKQKHLEEIRSQTLKGNYIRSRVRWIEEGEKPSKYFCNLESRNYVNKQIPKLILNDGTSIINQSEILRNFSMRPYT